MPKHCAEFRNEPQSVAMQRNLRHLFLAGGIMHYRPPSDIFGGGRVPAPVPRGIYATGWAGPDCIISVFKFVIPRAYRPIKCVGLCIAKKAIGLCRGWPANASPYQIINGMY